MRPEPIVTPQQIQENLESVRVRIADAADAANRSPDTVTLVAVSKTKPMSAIEAAYAAGQRDFGENRLEELWEKVSIAAERGLDEIRWHMIGTIQSRKSRQAVGPFTLVHSVDREKLAKRLSRDAEAASCVMQVLLEINVSGEESKHGFNPETLRSKRDELTALPGIEIRGMMTMAPFTADKTLIQPVFRGLRTLRDELSVSGWELPELSMGMTNDFEVAIAEGATIVRVGSAIFGARTY